jgi:hypothetical protein
VTPQVERRVSVRLIGSRVSALLPMEALMDSFALSLGKAICDASTVVVYAARCADRSVLRPVGYCLLMVLVWAIGFTASRVGAPR